MTLRRLDQVLLDRRVVRDAAGRASRSTRGARASSPRRRTRPVAEGTVLEEVRTGFLWDDQVLRTAEVIVSKGGAGKGERP